MCQDETEDEKDEEEEMAEDERQRRKGREGEEEKEHRRGRGTEEEKEESKSETTEDYDISKLANLLASQSFEHQKEFDCGKVPHESMAGSVARNAQHDFQNVVSLPAPLVPVVLAAAQVAAAVAGAQKTLIARRRRFEDIRHVLHCMCEKRYSPLLDPAGLSL